MPPTPGNIGGDLTNGLWPSQVTNPGTWLYTLERSTDLQDWIPLSSFVGTTGMVAEDTGILNPPLPDAFYRVQRAAALSPYSSSFPLVAPVLHYAIALATAEASDRRRIPINPEIQKSTNPCLSRRTKR